MKKPLWIGLAALTVLVLALTVLNKRWWARRIMRKWDINSNLEANSEMIANTSLRRWFELYRIGMPGWNLRGTAGGMQADGTAGDEQVSVTGEGQ